MTKEELLIAVQSKTGFARIVTDERTPDSPAGDLEKRYLLVETDNSDGTSGIYTVVYTHDTANNVAKFYNVEPLSLDTTADTPDVATLKALEGYLKSNFDAHFVSRMDLSNNWAEADVFKLVSGALEQSKIIVYKKGTAPIAHLSVV